MSVWAKATQQELGSNKTEEAVGKRVPVGPNLNRFQPQTDSKSMKSVTGGQGGVDSVCAVSL